MGGRGSSSLISRVSDKGLKERAEGIHKILAESGMPAKESVNATIERLRQFDVQNGNTQKALKEVIFPTRVKNMTSGFNRDANKEQKTGLKQGTNELYSQIIKNPNNFDKIVSNAINQHQANIKNINFKIMQSKSTREMNKLVKEKDVEFGKLNAAKFVSWAKKDRR